MWAKILTPFETLELASGPTLALSLIRGPRFDWAVEKATELGASTLVPLITNRSSPRASGEVKKSRWHRISEEARKQCGRPRPMMVLDPMTLGDWLASGLAGKKFLLDPGGPLLQCDSPAQVSLLVGPEGGLTNEEKQMALEVGFTSFSLGRLILRAETAAITALARLVGQLREDPIYQPNSSCPLVNFWKNV
jgi:16S rRNA (uracil1498-N3)-methyltransferase